MRRSLACIFVMFAIACSSAQHPPLLGADDENAGGIDAGTSAGDGGLEAGDNFGGGGGGTSTCGVVDRPQSQPLALPDTRVPDGNQPSCTSNSQCPASSPNCVITTDTDDGGPGYCAASFVDTLQFIGFAAGATLTDTSKLTAVCATLEHSWLGDLQIELISPDGKTIALRQFIGRSLDPYFLGHPDFCDSDEKPVPGVGYQYCWSASAPTTFLTADSSDCAAASGCEQWSGSPGNACGFDDDDDPPYQVVPAGSYLPDVPFSALSGAQLNGNWTFRVTDLWQEDNGYLFDWSIQFDSSLVVNCSAPIIVK